jgi:hypothetical protein
MVRSWTTMTLWWLWWLCGTWRGVAEEIGAYSPAYWCSVAAGRRRIGRKAENRLRFMRRRAPRGCYRVWDMPTEALARYLATRREVRP